VADPTGSQSDYYRDSADGYDAAHVRPGDEHYVALEYVDGLLGTWRATSVLDVGAGTGRALTFLRARHPELTLHGIEPVAELRAKAAGLDIRAGAAEALEAADGSYDVVMATALLHHVADPGRVVREMCRVASRAVVISDVNRYGFGSPARRRIKRALGRAGLLDPLIAARHGGDRRQYSAGDGYHYSFSALDCVADLRRWADRVFVVPTKGSHDGALTVESATHVLVVAARDPAAGDWAQP
jgi:ubiquinone/menaquinone biosynthesis C-methylase UbiE